jgi:RHS repeat-associated protein
MFTSVASNPTSHFTGKERDAETGLDYFGARYYSGAHGRFLNSDPGKITDRHLSNPQKWNKYAYVVNNPLMLIDPNGEDDFYVFRPLATSTDAAWRAVRAEAERYGHTVTIYNGKDATAGQFLKDLRADGAHVIQVGHAVVNDNDVAVGVLLSNNEAMGMNPDAKTKDTDSQKGSFFTPVPNVRADDVAIFGCNSNDLAGQYSDTTFTGISPHAWVKAEDAGAAAYADAMVRGGTVNKAAAAAQKAMVPVTEQQNNSPLNKDGILPSPQVCTTENGKTVCHK